MHGEAALEGPLAAAAVGEAGAGEVDVREAFDVEEVRGTQVRVAGVVAGVDAGRVDAYVDA